jgi:hypothetical protein
MWVKPKDGRAVYVELRKGAKFGIHKPMQVPKELEPSMRALIAHSVGVVECDAPEPTETPASPDGKE